MLNKRSYRLAASEPWRSTIYNLRIEISDLDYVYIAYMVCSLLAASEEITPPNSLRCHMWPQIWNLWPWLIMSLIVTLTASNTFCTHITVKQNSTTHAKWNKSIWRDAQFTKNAIKQNINLTDFNSPHTRVWFGNFASWPKAHQIWGKPALHILQLLW